MIHIRSGNLLKADAEALVNTVNCVGVMGKGIALQFKQAFPKNYQEYQKACRRKEVVPGKMFTYHSGTLINPKYIINFPTKRHWKGKSRLEDIKKGLIALAEEVKRLNVKSVAVPPLGCGNGGLAWSEVRPLIQEAFNSMPSLDVYLYEPSGAPAADAMPVRTKKPQMTRARALLIRLLDLYRIPDYRLTLHEVQKLAYFLQEAGEPLKLNFVKHKFGPYADNLNHVLQSIEGHYTRGYGDRSGGAQIYVLPKAREEALQFIPRENGTAKNRLDHVAKLIEGFETPYGLELLASIHWVATKERHEAKNDPEIAVEQMNSWNERKARIFSAKHIHKAWRRLHGQSWFANQATDSSRSSSATPGGLNPGRAGLDSPE